MMKTPMIKKCLLSAALASCIFTGINCIVPHNASAMIVYDPTNHTENLATKLQLIQSYAKQVQQYQTQLKNLTKLSSSYSSSSISQIQSIISKMNSINTSINSIGTDYTKAQARWDQTFKDYSTWNGVSASAYAKQATAVTTATENGIKQSLISQGLTSASEMASTANSLDNLVTASQNASGIVGVTQAASQIAALQVRETQRLQTIYANSARAQALYMQRQIEADKAAKQINSEFYNLDYDTTFSSTTSTDISD